MVSKDPKASGITVSQAILNWEADPKNEGKKLSDEEEVDLIFRGIGSLDGVNVLFNCRRLSLSSNIISKMSEISLPNLERLSLGRNKIK